MKGIDSVTSRESVPYQIQWQGEKWEKVSSDLVGACWDVVVVGGGTSEMGDPMALLVLTWLFGQF